MSVGDAALGDLKEWMVQRKTCPDLGKILLTIIDQWRYNRHVTNDIYCEFERCKNIFISQQMIGWRQLMGGCLSLEWSQAQESYYKWLGLKKTGKR